jgi:hypothetical protein
MVPVAEQDDQVDARVAIGIRIQCDREATESNHQPRQSCLPLPGLSTGNYAQSSSHNEKTILVRLKQMKLTTTRTRNDKHRTCQHSLGFEKAATRRNFDIGIEFESRWDSV